MPTMQPGVRKVVITCAVTGNAPFNPRHPAFPITPKDIAAACVEAARAGAAVVHVHVRDPNTGAGSRNPELFKETVDRLRDSGVDVILNLTAGLGGFLLPIRLTNGARCRRAMSSRRKSAWRTSNCAAPISLRSILRPATKSKAPWNSSNFNTTRTLRAMAKRFQELNIKPELETFSAGDVEFGKSLIAEGLISGVPLFQFVLGVKWGAPADSRTLLYMRDLLPWPAAWAALGPGRLQMPVVAQCTLLGGNVRVGLEDNLYLSRGVFATNGQLVERAKLIIESLGYEVASVGEARALLGVGPRGL